MDHILLIQQIRDVGQLILIELNKPNPDEAVIEYLIERKSFLYLQLIEL